MENLALLLIDLQKDYFPGGKMVLHESEAAVQKAAHLLDYFRRADKPVFHVQHISLRPNATFFQPGSDGIHFHPLVMPQRDERVISKHFPNCFRDTDLHTQLKTERIETLIVAGMMTHMCVDAGVRAAADAGFTCLIAADACATKELQFAHQVIPAPHVHGAFLAALDGTYGRVLKTAVLTKLLGK